APRRLDGVVTVSTKFDMYSTAVVNFPKRAQYRFKFDFSLSEQEMLVYAVPHIFNVNVPEPRRPVPKITCDRRFSLAVQVSNIESDAERWMSDSLKQLREARRRVNEHVRFRLERQPHRAFRGIVA